MDHTVRVFDVRSSRPCRTQFGYLISINSGLQVYCHQDRSRPTEIPNAQAVIFQVCIQNRYKLNKKYRKCLSIVQKENSETARMLLTQAKMSAEAEKKDNLAEQTRQHGKRVRYGEIVQLKHVFTGKFVHMSTTHTSKKDKNNMKISLIEFNAKNAQFRILPQATKSNLREKWFSCMTRLCLKVSSLLAITFHASDPYQIDSFSYGSELNLGVERSSFTLIGSYRDRPEEIRFVRGGCVVRLFHKELEAYLVAEGLFDEAVIEDVHFRIRAIDQHRIQSPCLLQPLESHIGKLKLNTAFLMVMSFGGSNRYV
ncbi:hypothetical protein Btru_072536 [Bulinus truncatus]|nr:hypothetical protein Btru_072536 [Bulinus truncatus]